MKLPEITERAAEAIRSIIKKTPEYIDLEEYLPSINWELGTKESGFAPGPFIGLHEKNRVPREYVSDSQGLKIAYNLPPEIMTKYDECVLDYVEGRFLFVERNMTPFLGGNENE